MTADWLAPRIKLCGISSTHDLAVAVEAGLDAIGVIVGTSHVAEDSLSVEAAARLLPGVPKGTVTVLVTHLRDPGSILEIAELLDVTTIQLHGCPSAKAMRQIQARSGGRNVTRAIHVNAPEPESEAATFAPLCDGIHLDTRTASRLGGTGQTHDWSISANIVDRLHRRGCPCILAGGLTPDNVEAAIRTVRPYGVDLNSGVESARGDKSRALVHAFVKRARECARPIGPGSLDSDPLGCR
ncbi:MAG TPA: phosphoribosylanthranilate isomerase [Solirubrobacterales bacterium]|jgi:phosphoribosylanthranilate isomerase|nr:phosphoribosylanthranilate isomerase [Solirubrobacterales bacterium]